MTNEALYFIGTCGYSYPGRRAFYPKAGRTRVDEFKFYSAHFNCVEIIFRPFTGQQAPRWRWLAKTPADFIFTAKVWQKFTHPTRSRRQAAGLQVDGVRQAPMSSASIAPWRKRGDWARCCFNIRRSFSFEAANVERLESALCNKFYYGAQSRSRATPQKLERPGAMNQALLGKFNTGFHRRTQVPLFGPSGDCRAGQFQLSALARTQSRKVAALLHSAPERDHYFYQPENIHRLAAKLKQLGGQAPTAKSYVFFNNRAAARRWPMPSCSSWGVGSRRTAPRHPSPW